jgi:hypothetical protein
MKIFPIVAFVITMTMMMGNSVSIANGDRRKLAKFLAIDAFTAVVLIIGYLNM